MKLSRECISNSHTAISYRDGRTRGLNTSAVQARDVIQPVDIKRAIQLFTHILENAANPGNVVNIFKVAYETLQEASKWSLQPPEADLKYSSGIRGVLVNELVSLRSFPQFWIGLHQMLLQTKRLMAKCKSTNTHSASNFSTRLKQWAVDRRQHCSTEQCGVMTSPWRHNIHIYELISVVQQSKKMALCHPL